MRAKETGTHIRICGTFFTLSQPNPSTPTRPTPRSFTRMTCRLTYPITEFKKNGWLSLSAAVYPDGAKRFWASQLRGLVGGLGSVRLGCMQPPRQQIPAHLGEHRKRKRNIEHEEESRLVFDMTLTFCLWYTVDMCVLAPFIIISFPSPSPLHLLPSSQTSAFSPSLTNSNDGLHFGGPLSPRTSMPVSVLSSVHASIIR
jgi:hypothetical protein